MYQLGKETWHKDLFLILATIKATFGTKGLPCEGQCMIKTTKPLYSFSCYFRYLVTFKAGFYTFCAYLFFSVQTRFIWRVMIAVWFLVWYSNNPAKTFDAEWHSKNCNRRACKRTVQNFEGNIFVFVSDGFFFIL